MKWRLSTIVATVTLCVCLGMIGLFWVSTPAIPAKDKDAAKGSMEEVIARAEKKWTTLQAHWLHAPTVSASYYTTVTQGLSKMKEYKLFVKEKLGNKYKLKRLRKSLYSYTGTIDFSIRGQYKEIGKIVKHWIWGLLLLALGMLLTYVPIPEVGRLVGLCLLGGWALVGWNLMRGPMFAWFMVIPIVGTIAWAVTAIREEWND